MTNIDPDTGEILELVPRLDAHGREIPDPTPLELPIGFKRPETLAEQVQRLVRHSVSQYAALHGHETFEEAEDFELDDEFDPSTPYETEFDPVIGKDITPAMFQDAEQRERLRQLYLEAERNAIRADTRQEAINEAYRASRKPKAPAASAAPSTPAAPKPA